MQTWARPRTAACAGCSARPGSLVTQHPVCVWSVTAAAEITYAIDFIRASPNPAHSVEYTIAGCQLLIDGFTSIALLNADVKTCILLALRAMDDAGATAAARTGHQHGLIFLWPLFPGDNAPAVICRTAIVKVSYTAHASLPALWSTYCCTYLLVLSHPDPTGQ